MAQLSNKPFVKYRETQTNKKTNKNQQQQRDVYIV